MAVRGGAHGAPPPGGEAAGQEEPPERVTITATRTPTPILEVPATVSVITSQQIEENLVTDIKDLVQFEPGVSVRSAPYRISAQASTGRGGNEGFNIRGLEGNRVSILTDGIRVPDAFDFGPQAVGRGDYVDLSLLKSVEILRGPASALYGSDGVAGAVSFITKDPGDFLAPDESWHAEGTVGFSSADESWAESPARRVPLRPLARRWSPTRGATDTRPRRRATTIRRTPTGRRPIRRIGSRTRCSPSLCSFRAAGHRLRADLRSPRPRRRHRRAERHRQAAARQHQHGRISRDRRDRPRPHRA